MTFGHWMRGGVGSAVIAASLVGLTSASAHAQAAGTEWYRQPPVQPAQPGAVQPAVQPGGAPPAAQPNAAQPPAQGGPVFAAPGINPALRPYQMPGINNPYNGYGSVSGIYPSAEMNTYVNASARAATARALFRQAESELGQAYRAAQRFFDQSPQYKQAIRDEQEAFAALTAARTKALASLESDSKYQRLLALREDLGDKLLDGRVHRTLGHDEVVAMATLKMSYATEMRAIEATALANEATVKEAQDRLVQAGARLSEMRAGFEESLRVNPEILMARRNLDDARIARLSSEAFLRAAIVNGGRALDYAYYLYRTPNQYDSYNVGYGSYYGY